MSERFKDGIKYGCHADLFDGEEPDDCVIEYGAPGDCIYGCYKNGQARRTKWTCKYWKPSPSPFQPERTLK